MSEKKAELVTELELQEIALKREICLLESQQIELEAKLEEKWKELKLIIKSK